MKLNATRRAIALALAILMIMGVAAVIWDVTANAEVENYAKGCSYTSTAVNFLEGKEDSGNLLTDGIIGEEETNGITVAYAGTEKTYTFVFDLGEVKYDIKTIKFMNVYINGNRDFGAESVKISVAKTAEKAGDVENTYTYESEVQYSTNRFNYIYDLSTEAVGRYVYIEIYSPNYVISLSELEIWGSGNPVVEDDEPTYINYALGNSYVLPDASYLSGFEDSGTLLTDGIVADEETQGVTVAYIGTDETYTIVFDLGTTRDDIKTVNIRNVKILSNRSFDPEKVVIGTAETMDSSEPNTYSYTYIKEEQSGSAYFDFIYTLDSVASGRYVYVTMNTPLYVLSLSEIEIWSKAQYNSSIVIPDEIDPNPKFDIVLSSEGYFTADGSFELLCSVRNITATYGIVAVDFVVSYNTVAFAPQYPSGADLSQYYIETCPMNGASMLWEDIGTYCDTEEGKVYMRFAHKEAENGDGTKKNDELVFKIIFKAKVSSGTYSFTASSCRGTDPGSSNYKKLTEVYANGSSCETTAKTLQGIVPLDEKITVSDGYIYGVAPGYNTNTLKSLFDGNVTVTTKNNNGNVGTGSVVTAENGESAVVIIFGDVDGSGVVDATDYLSVKKQFLKQLSLSGAAVLAADVDGNDRVDSTDYLAIKSHFLGVNKLY